QRDPDERPREQGRGHERREPGRAGQRSPERSEQVVHARTMARGSDARGGQGPRDGRIPQTFLTTAFRTAGVSADTTCSPSPEEAGDHPMKLRALALIGALMFATPALAQDTPPPGGGQ